MGNRKVAIVVARMGSTRLPGKSLLKFVGRPLIEWVLRIAMEIKGIDQVVFATSDLPQDTPLIEVAEKMGLATFRGSHEFVLDRVYGAAKMAKADVVVEIGGDCPLLDPDVLTLALEKFLKNDFDYVNNYEPPTFPEGMDVNILRFAAIEKAFHEAIVPSQRIHPFSYLSRHTDLFKIGQFAQAKDMAELHWSVDFAEDVDFIRVVYERLMPKSRTSSIRMQEVLDLISRDHEVQVVHSKTMKPKSQHAFWNSPGIIRDMHTDIELMSREASQMVTEKDWQKASRYYDEIESILEELKRLAHYRLKENV